ncbi:hypothetical protein SIID45300_00294 [Candidatus Magnetaquicoccaceae bacterium FCR-1]|uniref:Crp/Fnr family transcriptional regulator n=1 Tax=Candidatus Magnetaquiglobus chichijimensis TaxID=3141448 RepID=A0ABQ0C538_9PROT
MWMGNGDPEKRALLDLWRELEAGERQTLLRFGRFLISDRPQTGSGAPTEVVPVEPLAIPRPEVESAVAGLKRLKRTYPMIEADGAVLSEASRILMGKVTGATDREIIDQLEVFFGGCYETWREKHGS